MAIDPVARGLAAFAGSAAGVYAGGGRLWRDPRYLLVPVSCRNGLNVAIAGTNYAQSIRRAKRNGNIPVKNVRFRLWNGYGSTSTGLEITTSLPRLKVNMSVFCPRSGGTLYPVYSPSGSHDIFLEPGQILDAFADPALTIAAQTNFYVHYYVTAVDSSGAQLTSGRIPVGRFTVNNGNECAAFDASASDHTTSNNGETTAIASPANLFDSFVMLGEPITSSYYATPTNSTSYPSVACFGDSITFGFNEHNAMTGDSDGNTGWAERWYGSSTNYIGMVNMGISGTKASQWTTMANGNVNNRIANLLKDVNFTHAQISLGTNDFGNRTGAQVYADNTALAAWLYNTFGIKCLLVTQTPVTSSTDSWATLNNQSLTNSGINETARLAYNALVRANSKPTGVIGYIELADIFESSRDSGKWKVDGTANKYTSDGIHPQAAANILVPTALGAASNYLL